MSNDRTTSTGGTARVVLTMDDDALDRLADLVARRLAAVLTSTSTQKDRWLNAREAAEHLGLASVAQLHKLTARREVPVHQDRPGGRLYFRRSELDRWRGA